MGPQGCRCGNSPNPIHGGTGNKYWSETDYLPTGANRLQFSRYYNSHNSGVVNGTMGRAWRHGYDHSITTAIVNNRAFADMTRASGATYSFAASGNAYIGNGTDISDQLIALRDAAGNIAGWQYLVAADKSIENYDAAGKLVSIRDQAGLVQTLTYSDSTTPVATAPRAGFLIRVADPYGRQLNLTYDSLGRINQLTDPAGGKYLYRYGPAYDLVSVTYPDTRVKGYLYNEAAFTGNNNLPTALTGVVDENNSRFATYRYNAQGQAISSEHAGGVNRYQLTYRSNSTTITDPMGSARAYDYQPVLGVIRATSQSVPGGTGDTSARLTYDSNGNIASRTDFNGNVTTYAYDLASNLEIRRVEASNRPQARTITTQWHLSQRLPESISEPLRRTSFVYDASGNLLSKTVQATADATGVQGLTAATTGAARRWTYTYNNAGQVLTTKGPRTDADDVTTYAYDAQGNLASVTNALGHVTTLSNYDAHGHAGRITDANGVTTDMSYHPRGWLTSRTVTGAGSTETTSYAYDGVGQLTQVNLPDGSAVTYTYDPAHRLTAIADSLGNRIVYTLDAIGNRISEQVRDPNGQLTRQTTRVYDALNRLQQITGSL